MKSSIYLMIAHGSKDPAAAEAFQELLMNFRRIISDRRIEGCYLESAKPLLKESLDDFYQSGVRVFFLIPLLLFPGRHVREDIPQILADFRLRCPDADLHFSSPLGSDPHLLRLLEDKLRALEILDSKKGKKS